MFEKSDFGSGISRLVFLRHAYLSVCVLFEPLKAEGTCVNSLLYVWVHLWLGVIFNILEPGWSCHSPAWRGQINKSIKVSRRPGEKTSKTDILFWSFFVFFLLYGCLLTANKLFAQSEEKLKLVYQLKSLNLTEDLHHFRIGVACHGRFLAYLSCT